jgi:hypothetical protein
MSATNKGGDGRLLKLYVERFAGGGALDIGAKQVIGCRRVRRVGGPDTTDNEPLYREAFLGLDHPFTQPFYVGDHDHFQYYMTRFAFFHEDSPPQRIPLGGMVRPVRVDLETGVTQVPQRTFNAHGDCYTYYVIAGELEIQQ